jgi:hypothetical protein
MIEYSTSGSRDAHAPQASLLITHIIFARATPPENATLTETAANLKTVALRVLVLWQVY